MKWMLCLRELWAMRKSLVVVLTPLVLIPLPIIMKDECVQEFRALYGLLVIAIYWVTEALPLPITALLPMVIFPLLGIVKASELSRDYFKDTNMLFIGGFMMAVAIEKWNLNKRIALKVLLLAGPQPKWLMLGFMVPTAFLSMWISNTATTAMMVPIARAVIQQLTLSAKGHQVSESGNNNGTQDQTTDINMAVLETPKEPTTNSYVVSDQKNTDEEKRRLEKMSIGVTLSVAYAATCGGVATLTGTGTNLVLKGQTDSLFNGQSGLNYTTWFVFAFPCSLLALALTYIWLQLHFLGFRNSIFVRSKNTPQTIMERLATETILKKELEKLGRLSFAEIMVALHLVGLAVLWFTRESDFFPGWDEYISGGFASDSTPAILLAISLFIVPSYPPKIFRSTFSDESGELQPQTALLDWTTVREKFAWGIVLLLGGGYALATACQKSGLSHLIASELTVLRHIPPWAMCIVITFVIAGVTEVTSNVAIASIFLPILAQLGVGIGVNPLYLMIPGCMATSFAFMLPVATPPNAIIFSYGGIKVIDMAKAGFILNLICVGVVNLAINTWGNSFFQLEIFPEWANNTSSNSMSGFSCYNLTKN